MAPEKFIQSKAAEAIKALYGADVQADSLQVAVTGAALSSAVIANYAYDLAKEFNQYYHDTPILREEDPAGLAFLFADRRS